MLLSSEIKIPLCVKLACSLPTYVFSVKKRNYLKLCICKNSCEDTLLQCYRLTILTVLTKEKETGSEDENILLKSVNVPTMFS